MEVFEGEFVDHVRLVFNNLSAIAEAAGGTLNDFVKVNVFLTDLNNFATVNEMMEEFFSKPYPAREKLFPAILSLPNLMKLEA